MAKELKRASFIKRLCAYAIDFLIILMVTSIITIPFTDSKEVLKIQDEANGTISSWRNYS